MSAAAGRLGRGRAVALVVLLGLVLFGLTLPTWATAVVSTTVGTEDLAVGGADAAPAAASAALVVVVAGLVLALSGRVTRVLAVLGVVVGGALGAWSIAGFLTDPRPALEQAAAAVSGVAQIDGDPDLTVLPVLALVVAAAITLVGLTLPFLAGRWQQVGRRYEVSAPPPPGPTDRRTQARHDWDALSRGDDPSAPD